MGFSLKEITVCIAWCSVPNVPDLGLLFSDAGSVFSYSLNWNGITNAFTEAGLVNHRVFCIRMSFIVKGDLKSLALLIFLDVEQVSETDVITQNRQKVVNDLRFVAKCGYYRSFLLQCNHRIQSCFLVFICLLDLLT